VHRRGHPRQLPDREIRLLQMHAAGSGVHYSGLHLPAIHVAELMAQLGCIHLHRHRPNDYLQPTIHQHHGQLPRQPAGDCGGCRVSDDDIGRHAGFDLTYAILHHPAAHK